MTKPIRDWQNKRVYPKAGSLSGSGWAWEFLRRNPAYQEAWGRYDALVSEHVPPGASDAEAAAILDSDPFLHYDPPKLEGEDGAAWIGLVGRGKTRPLDLVIAEEWGLCGSHPSLPNPFYEPTQGAFVFISFDASPRVSSICGAGAKAPDYGDPTQAFLIDYRLPLGPQLKALKTFAERQQKRLVDKGAIGAPPIKKARQEWPTYLQILDADLAGVLEKEITKVLYGEDTYGDGHPNATKARTGIATARALRDGGYMWLPTVQRKRKEK